MDGGIKFDVSATTAKFDADMARVGNSANTAASKIKNAFSGIGGLLVGGAVAAGLKRLMDDFDRVGKLATRFGTSAESIQRVSVAADIAGTNIEQVANAMTKAGVAASQAVEKGGTMAETFERAGINAQKFAAAQLDQKLLMVAEAFAAAQGDANKTNAIIEILGTRAGANLIPLISNVQALKDEMAGVAAASDDAVRKIEAANDRMTRFFNNVKVGAADGIQYFTEFSERIGTIIAQENGLLKLIDALAKARGGNVQPLFEIASFGKTIAELEEIEARTTAIQQLTNESALDWFDASRNAELIAERTKQILEQTRGTAQQSQIAEDSTDRVLGIEKEKTAELERQQKALERQEQQRQQSIRSMEQEIRLIEAQLSGNKELEESLRQQADFDAAMEKTGNFETASNFAATKAAERMAQASDQAPSVGGGGGSLSGGSFAPSLNPTQDQSVAQMRADAARNRRMRRFDEFMAGGQFRSAARTQEAAERAADRILQNQRERDFMRDNFDGSNIGESLRNFERDARNAGMTPDDALRRMGIDRAVGEDRADALNRFVEEQSKTPEERNRMEQESRQNQPPGGGGDKQSGNGILNEIKSTLEQFKSSMEERLPQTVLAT